MSDKISAAQRKSIISFWELEVDSEIELGHLYEFEGSGIMSGSGADNPCVDRTFVGQTLYRCLGDFMKEAYVAKIEQRQMQPKKMCMLFEDGFQCFEKKIQRDNDDMCTAHDLYDIGSWFKTEIFTDFGVDVRGCPYPGVPQTPVPPQISDSPGISDVREESSHVALVAGIVLGVAVMALLVMSFFVIFSRRFKKEMLTAPPPESCHKEQCHVTMTDTNSTLTGLSSERSLHHASYESVRIPAQRAISQHIYTEIDNITENAAGHMDDVTRMAPIGCFTCPTGYMPPDFSYHYQWQHGAPLPVKDMTVDYVASGGHYTHAHAPVHQSTTTEPKVYAAV